MLFFPGSAAPDPAGLILDSIEASAQRMLQGDRLRRAREATSAFFQSRRDARR